jgi:hypothetical protein
MKMAAVVGSSILAAMFPLYAAVAAPDPVPVSPPPLPGSIESHSDWPTPKSNQDVDTVEHLVAALYDVISGAAGKPRDWDRFRALFLPDGRLASIRPATPAKDNQAARPGDTSFRSPALYIERNDPYFKTHGFFERGIANRQEDFGNLVHVWSTYESRNTLAEIAPFARGINSIQIVRAHDRFWIASILWDEERPGVTLPEKYVPSPANAASQGKQSGSTDSCGATEGHRYGIF